MLSRDTGSRDDHENANLHNFLLLKLLVRPIYPPHLRKKFIFGGVPFSHISIYWRNGQFFYRHSTKKCFASNVMDTLVELKVLTKTIIGRGF